MCVRHAMSKGEAQIEALRRHHLGETARRFDPILGQDAGVKTAPDSLLYRRCLAALRTAPAETLAIEDSRAGLHAARAAGLPCAVFYNDYTFGESFAGAALVARSCESFHLDQLAELCLRSAEVGGKLGGLFSPAAHTRLIPSAFPAFDHP